MCQDLRPVTLYSFTLPANLTSPIAETDYQFTAIQILLPSIFFQLPESPLWSPVENLNFEEATDLETVEAQSDFINR
jgi:hypothetical protein